jgi:hypothetical protein
MTAPPVATAGLPRAGGHPVWPPWPPKASSRSPRSIISRKTLYAQDISWASDNIMHAGPCNPKWDFYGSIYLIWKKVTIVSYYIIK